MKVLLRETYDARGQIKRFDAKDAERTTRDLKLADAAAPSLSADTARLVVLDLPYRSLGHVYAKHGVQRDWLMNDSLSWTFEFLDNGAATELFAAEFADHNPDALKRLYRHCFSANGGGKAGHFTILAAAELPVSGEPDFIRLCTAAPREPLLAYLALENNPKYRQWHRRLGLYLGDTVPAESPFLQRLAQFNDLSLRWGGAHANRGTDAARKTERDRALAFVKANKASPVGFAMLALLQDRADDADFHRAVADAWKLFDKGDLRYLARYEHARGLARAGKKAEASAEFRALYRTALRDGAIPAIDSTFRDALQQDASGDSWPATIREAADGLLQQKDRAGVVTLAWQCWQLGDPALSDRLLTDAMASPANDTELLVSSMAAVEFLSGTERYEMADSVLRTLLQHAKFGKEASLWRIGSRLATQRDRTAESIARLETALDLEFQNLPPTINLEELRRDYARLLNHYRDLAHAVRTMDLPVPADLLPRTVKAADRWRMLDRDGRDHCTKAAEILKQLGARDLAWDYLTTPIGQKPNEAKPWRDLGQTLARQGELDLADRAFAAAFGAEPNDAELLWERARNLQRSGKLSEAEPLLRQIAEGNWQARFNHLKSQARWQLQGR